MILTGAIMTSNDFPVDKAEEEYKDLVFDVKYDKEQFKDPMTIGLLLYRLSRERAKTNELFTKILEKLDQISENTTPKTTAEQTQLVAEIDQQIISYIKDHQISDAEEVRRQFGYKGKNAASARLNSLYNQGLLKKKRAGKKVKYWVEI